MPYPDYPIPADESQRQRELERQGVLGRPGDEHFNRLVRLAATIFETPIALISLVDGDRQWFLARHGLELEETPRQMAFCAHAIVGDSTLVVPDASQDPRFCGNPLVSGEPLIRFYAGSPLQNPEGHNLGTLCVIDRHPRTFSTEQVKLLEELAQLVLRELELRRLATVCQPTGLPNRNSFLEQAEPELQRARQSNAELALLALEIDHFSQVRHRWGPEVSEQALLDTANCLRSQHCSSDLIGQIGDQAFAMLMVGVDLDSAMERTEAIQAGINDLGGVFRRAGHRLEISAGLTKFAPGDGRALDLLLRAEQALFVAQGNGHNQIAKMVTASTPATLQSRSKGS